MVDDLTKRIVDEAINSGVADQRMKAYEIQVKDWAEKINRELVMYHDIAVKAHAQIDAMNQMKPIRSALFIGLGFILGLFF